MKLIWPTIPNALWWWIWGGLGVRTAVAWLQPVGFDEVYYYLYSRHLNWSYFDHPPVVAVTTGVGWWLTHIVTPLTLRIGALTLYTVGLVLLYLLAKHLFDHTTGVLAVAIASISPLLWLTFGVLTSPDDGLMAFWALTLLIAAHEFIPNPSLAHSPDFTETYRPSWRIGLMGITLGLACLSKYHGFILGLGLVGFCLTSNRTRKALWSPWTAIALAGFLLALLPLWIWNSQHDWISFRFHLVMRFDGGPPSPYRPLDALVTWGLGLVYLFPTLGLPLWWCTGTSLVNHLRSYLGPPLTTAEIIKRDRTALILWVSVPIALGFTLLGGKQAIYPAWPAPGFWGLTLLLAHAASRGVPSRIQRRWLTGSALVIGTLILVALLHLSLGILQKPSTYSLFGGLVPPQDDGSTALINTGQLRSRLAQAPELRQAIQTTDFIFTDEFYLSAYVDMALQPLTQRPITCFSQDPRGFAFWSPPTAWVGKQSLYITLASLHPDLAALEAEFRPYFATLAPLAEVNLTRGGVVVETVLIYETSAMERPYSYPYGV